MLVSFWSQGQSHSIHDHMSYIPIEAGGHTWSLTSYRQTLVNDDTGDRYKVVGELRNTIGTVVDRTSEPGRDIVRHSQIFQLPFVRHRTASPIYGHNGTTILGGEAHYTVNWLPRRWRLEIRIRAVWDSPRGLNTFLYAHGDPLLRTKTVSNEYINIRGSFDAFRMEGVTGNQFRSILSSNPRVEFRYQLKDENGSVYWQQTIIENLE